MYAYKHRSRSRKGLGDRPTRTPAPRVADRKDTGALCNRRAGGARSSHTSSLRFDPFAHALAENGQSHCAAAEHDVVECGKLEARAQSFFGFPPQRENLELP